jgi:hypothetical protein
LIKTDKGSDIYDDQAANNSSAVVFKRSVIMSKEELHDIVLQKDAEQIQHRGLSMKDLEALLLEYCPQHINGALERMERRARIHRDVLPDPDKVALFAFFCQARGKTDAMLNTDLEGLSHEKQFHRVAEYHKYTDLGSAILYENYRFGGRSVFMSVPWPSLSWKPYKFNDKASSVKGWGVNVFFKGSWWRTEGQNPLWVVGVPYIEHADLRQFDFDDRITSYLP